MAGSDGRRAIRVYERGCGATTDFVTHVDFVSEKSISEEVLLIKGRTEVVARWKCEKEVEVSPPESARTEIIGGRGRAADGSRVVISFRTN